MTDPEQPPESATPFEVEAQFPHLSCVEGTAPETVPPEPSVKPELVIDREEAGTLVAALIAQAVKRRKELGLTQYDISDLSGIPQGRVSPMERGGHMPLADTLIRYLAAIGGRLMVDFGTPPKQAKPKRRGRKKSS